MAYNKTQLNPDVNFERHVYHRDQFAHYLRWSHLVRCLEVGDQVLDAGCGTANLLKMMYHNRKKARFYLGIDVRKQIIDKMEAARKDPKQIDKPNFPHEFRHHDLVTMPAPRPPKGEWDYVVSFEVFEHIGKKNGPAFLDNVAAAMGPDTIFMMSTPCFNGKAANNHIVDGEVGEWGYQELKDLLEQKFELVDHWGTFASQADIRPRIIDTSIDISYIYGQLATYYDTELLSVMFAPIFPEASRNCLWKVRRKS